MPDNLTTPRQLHQIHWENGITEGDIRPGFMKELLNVEMDEGGRIRCRDGLVSHDIFIPTTDPSKFYHINGDPSARHNAGWNVFFTIDKVYIYPYGSDMDNDDSAEIVLSYQIDISTIEIVVIGTTLVLSSINPDGDPNPVISVVWTTDEGRFSPPSYIGEGDDLYYQQPGHFGWGVHEFNKYPTVHSFVVPFTDSYDAGIRREGRVQLETAINEVPENGVGLYITSQPKDTVTPATMGFTGEASVKLVCLFVFADGSLSIPSEEVTVEINADDKEQTFDLGVSLHVHKNLLKSVVGIRVYRKILAGNPVNSGEFDFLFYAPLYDTDIHQDTLIEPSLSSGNRDVIKAPEMLIDLSAAEEDYTYIENEENYGLSLREGAGLTFKQNKVRMTDRVMYSHDFGNGTANNTMKETAGWFITKAGSDVLVYSPAHWYNSGGVVIRYRQRQEPIYEPSTGDYVHYSASMFIQFLAQSVRVTDRFNRGSDASDDYTVNDYEYADGAMVIGSAIGPPAMLNFTWGGDRLSYKPAFTDVNNNTDVPNYDKDSIVYRGYFRLMQNNNEGYNFEYIPASNVDMDITTSTVPSDGNEGFERTLVICRDNGKAGNLPTLENEYGGASISDLANIKPRHIGAAGGRLFALNLIEDDRENTSKMMYSEIGNFAAFRKDSYIDYGVRDDGYGIAVSTLKSYVIAHHSASTYVFDIAGGSDFTWREVSAFKDVGSLHDNLTSTTPFGVFWCDKKHIWFYNGGGVQPITKEIKNTYRKLVPNLSRLLYKQDLKQLWLISTDDSPIYVFDIDGGRWHQHKLTEFGIDGRHLDSIFNVSDRMIIDTSEDDYDSHNFFEFTEDADSVFDWGLEVGQDSFKIPEIIKKVRRMYLHLVRYPDYRDEDKIVEIQAKGSTSGDITIEDDLVINDEQIRISTSVRGYHVNFKILVKGSTFWRGKLESLGISYKPKKLK